MDWFMKTWYRRAVLGFGWGALVAILSWVVFTNFFPEDHERWLRQGSYLVLVVGMSILFALLNEKLHLRLERRINNFFAQFRRRK